MFFLRLGSFLRNTACTGYWRGTLFWRVCGFWRQILVYTLLTSSERVGHFCLSDQKKWKTQNYNYKSVQMMENGRRIIDQGANVFNRMQVRTEKIENKIVESY